MNNKELNPFSFMQCHNIKSVILSLQNFIKDTQIMQLKEHAIAVPIPRGNIADATRSLAFVNQFRYVEYSLRDTDCKIRQLVSLSYAVLIAIMLKRAGVIIRSLRDSDNLKNRHTSHNRRTVGFIETLQISWFCALACALTMQWLRVQILHVSQ